MSVNFEIHPTIGIARLGTSDGFFVGPEPDGTPPPSYRDAGGILRQAARFRVFRVDRDDTGTILEAREVTPAEGDVTWTVHLANRKATAFKVEEPRHRRNGATGRDDADKTLIIDAGARSVSSALPRATFDTGLFRGTAIPLGEVRFESRTGRLVVLGGKGHSGFVLPLGPDDDPSKTPKHFADNDGWFDDTSEGPVTAALRLKATGEEPEVTGARVIVAPPDFAPDIQNFVTLYDIVYQMALEKNLITRPARFSFMRFVHPVLMRACGYRWVNAAAGRGHAGHAPNDFEANVEALADPGQSSTNQRQVMVAFLRAPGTDGSALAGMPRLFSQDGYPGSPRPLALTPIQHEAMTRWANATAASSDFLWDFPDSPWAKERLPDALDRVALEACTGGAFFPGIEVPRFVQDEKQFESTLPVRLKRDLPAGIVNAGSAVPWQADFYDCQWEGSRDATTKLESFERKAKDFGWWPAQRPDSVFTDAALEKRERWAQGIGSKRTMVSRWHTRRFVLRSTNAEGKTVYILEPGVTRPRDS
jgi:hypothetical protein